MKFEDEIATYEITYGDKSLSIREMRNIGLLSPYLPDVPHNPFNQVGSSSREKGIDKWFIAPQIGDCRAGTPGCSSSPVYTGESFLENAQANLAKGEDQLLLLDSFQLPSELEPVRVFLRKTLQSTLAFEQGSYDYIKTGKVDELQKVVCAECVCNARDPIFVRMEQTTDRAKRLEIASFAVNNVLAKCQYTNWVYPIGAWKKFIADFHVQEKMNWHLPL